MPNFKTPQKVSECIRASDEVEIWRENNRVKITNMANGFPTVPEEKAKRIGLRVNCNFGELSVIFQHAKRQYSNAFQARGKFFKVQIPTAPVEEKLDWETFITQHLNRVMKKSRKYYEQGRSVWGAVVPYGLGPSLWEDKESWCPSFVGLEDLRIPTDTQVSFENLCWFAVRKMYTPGELAKKVFGPNGGKNWDKPTIKKILNKYQNEQYEQTSLNWIDSPEKMWELIKQNFGFYISDAVPTIPLWHFFYLDDSDPKKMNWKLLVIPTAEIRGVFTDYDQFLYKSDKPFAKEISEILHLQVGDLNTKPPYLVNAVRSLGNILMEPCFWTNLLRCRLLQHTFESFNIWLRVQDPAGSQRAQKIELFNQAIVPDGVSIVPQEQRHQVDASLISGVMGELKQLQQEASVSYTQDTESGATGTQDETATAVMARVTSVNAMMSGLLNTAFRYETFKYQEICRRFCLSKTSDPDARAFQEACRKRGIPRIYLNSDLWDVEPEIPMGSGNPTMEMAQAQQLLAMRPMFGPTAQQEILHEATIAITGDSRKADRWTPLDGKTGMSSGQEWAAAIFGTLMHGVPVKQKEGIPLIDAIETLLGLMAGVIARIEAQTNLASPNELAGLQNVGQYIGGMVQQLAQNEAEGERVKQYSDSLGKLDNILKGFAQRLAEQEGEQTNGQLSPEAQAKIVETGMVAEAKLKSKAESDAQKMEHKQMAFQNEQARKNQETLAEIGRETLIQMHAPKPPSDS